MVRFRLRAPDGTVTLSLPETTTIADLKSEIATKAKVDDFDLKKGYPPQPLDLDSYPASKLLSDTDLKLSNEQLIVAPKQSTVPARHTTGPPPSQTKPSPAPQPLPMPASSDDDPPELPLPRHGGVLLMRVMPDDNSCLFRAVSSAVFGAEIEAMHELRALVADAIRAAPTTYTAAILDKDPEAYCRWIQTGDAWGGAIEMAILAAHFDIEIASVSVRDGRVDRFNEGASRRAILVYSQIHYDVLALSREDSLGLGVRRPPEQDVKLFDSSDDELLGRALELCAILRKRHYFTDTTSFSILCNTCGWTGNGELAAVKHAEATGHGDFGEAPK